MDKKERKKQARSNPAKFQGKKNIRFLSSFDTKNVRQDKPDTENFKTSSCPETKNKDKVGGGGGGALCETKKKKKKKKKKNFFKF